MAKIIIGVQAGKNKKDQEFEIKFDYLAIRKFGRAVGMNKPSELEGIFNAMDLNDPSFDDIDTIAQLVRAGIKHMKVPTFEEVLESLLANPDSIAKVFDELNGATEVDVTEVELSEEEKKKAEEKK